MGKVGNIFYNAVDGVRFVTSIAHFYAFFLLPY